MIEPASNLQEVASPTRILAQQGASVPSPPMAANLACPLVVDLDGTLIKTDLLIESVARLLRQEPLAFLAVPLWLLKGRAYLKHEIAKRVELDPALLPYRTALLEYLRTEHDKGAAGVQSHYGPKREACGDHERQRFGAYLG